MDDQDNKGHIDTHDLYGPSDENIKDTSDSGIPQGDNKAEKDLPANHSQSGGVQVEISESSSQNILDDPLSRPELPPKKNISVYPAVKAVILLFTLFAVGLVIGAAVRQYEMTESAPVSSGLEEPGPDKTPEAAGQDDNTSPAPQDGTGWMQYPLIRGYTKSPVEGIRFFLPEDVLGLVCDGADCASQGTYLPGGTRLTVAPRGTNEILPGYAQGDIVDGSGRAFVLEETTVSGFPATAYTAEFEGTALNGYSFSRMRGVMIRLSDGFTLEVNHFSPKGVVADFEGDSELFELILQHIGFDGSALPPSDESVQDKMTPN